MMMRATLIATSLRKVHHKVAIVSLVASSRALILKSHPQRHNTLQAALTYQKKSLKGTFHRGNRLSHRTHEEAV